MKRLATLRVANQWITTYLRKCGCVSTKNTSSLINEIIINYLKISDVFWWGSQGERTKIKIKRTRAFKKYFLHRGVRCGVEGKMREIREWVAIVGGYSHGIEVKREVVVAAEDETSAREKVKKINNWVIVSIRPKTASLKVSLRGDNTGVSYKGDRK